ncbi:MAG TPA: hypothetical protein VLG44_03205 [Chlamydiales bacterium]|nr:hypothetical protein [Chlamydiales bacterium]
MPAAIQNSNLPEVLKNDFPEPTSQISHAKCRSILWYTASIVATLALSAIAAFSAYSFLMAYPALYLLIPILSVIPLLSIGSIYSNLITRSSMHDQNAAKFKAIDTHLKKIENFSHSEMADLLRGHGIDTQRIPFNDFSERTVKILAAHYLYHVEYIEELQNYLADQNNPIPLTETSTDDEVEFYYTNRAALKEAGIFMEKIVLAFIQERFYHPDVRAKIDEVGIIQPKSFSTRQALQLHLQNNSPYFTFRDGRDPIAFSTMEYLTPAYLQQRIFS